MFSRYDSALVICYCRTFIRFAYTVYVKKSDFDAWLGSCSHKFVM